MNNSQNIRQLYYALRKKKLSKLQTAFLRQFEADLLFTYFLCLGTYCFSTYERVSFGFSAKEYINEDKKYYQIALLFQDPYSGSQFQFTPTEIFWNADIRHRLQAHDRELIEFSSEFPPTQFDGLSADEIFCELTSETGRIMIWRRYQIARNWTTTGLWISERFNRLKENISYKWLHIKFKRKYRDDDSDLPF